MKRVTLKNLADALHISVATVSRALANDPAVKPETRRLVIETANRIGYRRNVAAAQLRSGKTHTVGIIVNEVTSSFACRVILGIQEILLKKDIRIIIASSDNDTEKELLNLRRLVDTNIDGLIISPCHRGRNSKEFNRLIEQGLPIVFFNNIPADVSAPTVMANDYDKAYYMLDHIIGTGRHNILHLRGSEEMHNYPDILRAYRDVLMKHDIPYRKELVLHADTSLESGAAAIDHAIAEGLQFDAVFACNDLPAIGAMNRLQALGHAVPGDVAVAGFSGSNLAKITYPALTTSEPPLHEMGETAARLLLQLIDNDEKPESVVINAHIHLRASTHPENQNKQDTAGDATSVSTEREPLAMIVAAGRDGAIGRDNSLLWNLPGDLPRFKKLTSGHPVVMGRRTWMSLPRRPLPGRLNVVLSSDPSFNAEGGVTSRSLREALDTCRREAPGVMPFIIGGGTLYEAALPLATHLYITYVDADTPDADTYMPADYTQGFRIVASADGEKSERTPEFRFIDYERE